MRSMIIEPSPHRAGFYRLLGSIPSQLLPVLRSTVGALKAAGIWVVPGDIVEQVTGKKLEHWGESPSRLMHLINKKLYPYQIHGVLAAMQRKRLLINFLPGTGKTPTAIEVMRLLWLQADAKSKAANAQAR